MIFKRKEAFSNDQPQNKRVITEHGREGGAVSLVVTREKKYPDGLYVIMLERHSEDISAPGKLYALLDNLLKVLQQENTEKVYAKIVNSTLLDLLLKAGAVIEERLPTFHDSAIISITKSRLEVLHEQLGRIRGF